MEENKKRNIEAYILTLACCILLLLVQYNCTGRKEAENALVSARQNVCALSDTLSVVRSENGRILAKKTALSCSLEEYESLAKKQSKEIRRLQKELDQKIDYISDLNLSIGRVDTVFAEVSKVGDTLAFSLVDSFRTLEGYVASPNVAITKDQTRLSLKVGMTEEGEVFATTDNPNVTFTHLDGALLSEDIRRMKAGNERKWSVGLSLTAGIGTSCGFGTMGAGASLTLGIGIQRKLFDF